jgi:hypothetical protein
MSAGVMPVHVATRGLVGLPRSKAIVPLTPAAPRWMCMSVASTALCTHVTVNVAAGWSSCPKQPPLAGLGTGGTI